nr:MAG TPA: hypothetical protein [Caudoviricetes sp.]
MCNAYFAKQCKGIRYYRMFLFDRKEQVPHRRSRLTRAS